jgi:hypothetical protein
MAADHDNDHATQEAKLFSLGKGGHSHCDRPLLEYQKESD